MFCWTESLQSKGPVMKSTRSDEDKMMKRRSSLPRLAAPICAALLLFTITGLAQTQSVLTRQVREGVADGQALLVGKLPATQSLHFDIVLQLRDRAGLPSLLINLISESMNQALVPTLIRVREQEGHDRAQQLLSSSMLWMCLLLVAASAAMALTAHGFFPLIASHFPQAKLELAIQIFYALLPVVLITGIATNCTAVLNTFDRFALPALAPVVISVSIILSALLLGGRFGIWAMVYGTLAGSLIHAAIVAWMMDSHGYRFRLRWYGMTEAAREVGHQYGPVLLSSVVASGGLLVDQSMAAMLPAGSVSALVYANRFVSVVLTLLAGAVSTAVVPYLSSMIAHRDWSGCPKPCARGPGSPRWSLRQLQCC